MGTNTKILKYSGIGFGMAILLGGIYYFKGFGDKTKNEYINNSMANYGISYGEAEKKWNDLNNDLDKPVSGGKRKNRRTKRKIVTKNKTTKK